MIRSTSADERAGRFTGHPAARSSSHAGGRFSGWRGWGGAALAAHLGCGDTRHGVGEGGEVEVCQVVHDMLAHAGQDGRIGLLQPGRIPQG